MVQLEDLARRLVHHAAGVIELKVHSQAEAPKGAPITSEEPFPYSSSAEQMTWPNDLEEQPEEGAAATEFSHELPIGQRRGAELPQGSEPRTATLWPARVVQAAMMILPSLTPIPGAKAAGAPPQRLSQQVRSVSFGPVEVHEVECWKQLTKLQHASRKELRQAARAEEQDRERLWEFEMDDEEDEENTQHGECCTFSTQERASKITATSLMRRWRRWILMMLSLILFEVAIKVFDGIGEFHIRSGVESALRAHGSLDLRAESSSDFQNGREGHRRNPRSVRGAGEDVGETSDSDALGAAPQEVAVGGVRALPDAAEFVAGRQRAHLPSAWSRPLAGTPSDFVASLAVEGSSGSPAHMALGGGALEFVVTQDGGVRRRTIS